MAAGLAVLVPMLHDGSVLGQFGNLSQTGLTMQAGGVHLHIFGTSDLVNSLAPWTNLAWQQVHQGHLPLWNPYGGLGMPLAFNWQSAPFGLPALVSYLGPQRDILTVEAAVNLVVAGTGAYVFARVLGMGAIASAAVGTVFELSGPFVAWLGYPFPSVLSWAGWILAFGLLTIRGRHRAASITGLAVSIGFSLCGGAPEGFVVLGMAAVVFFGVVLLRRTHWLRGSGPIRRPIAGLVAGALAGCALAAPFALPSLQLASHSVRNGSTGSTALPAHAVVYLAMQAFDGLPIFHHGTVVVMSGEPLFYAETAAYVGVITLVLAVIASVRSWKRPVVSALIVAFLVCLALVYVPEVSQVISKFPVIGSVNWLRALMPLAILVAALSGFGLDLVAKEPRAGRTARWLGVGFGGAAVLLLLTWIVSRNHLTAAQASVRDHSFIWPAVTTAAGLGAAGFLWWTDRRSRNARPGADTGDPTAQVSATRRSWDTHAGAIAAVFLLAVETVFLVSAATTMMPSSSHTFPQTSGTRSLVASVGSGLVGVGPGGFSLGLTPNINDVYGLHQLAVYDPIIPKDYFTAWPADAGTAPGYTGLNLFTPAVTSVAVAREFGVQYLLLPGGHPPLPGTVFVRAIGNEDLYRVPDAGQATVVPASGGVLPPASVTGTPVPVTHPGPAAWRVTTRTTAPSVLRLHLTDVPGWRASIDGRPLALETYAGMMLQARIPAGVHEIELRYWPEYLTYGLVLAALSVLFLAAILIVSSLRHRRLRGAGSGSGQSGTQA